MGRNDPQQAILFADPQVGWDASGASASPFRYDGKARAKAIYAKMGSDWPNALWGGCIGDVVGRGTDHYPPSDYSFLQVKEDWDRYLPFGFSQMCVTSGNHDWDYAIGDPVLYGSQRSFEGAIGNRYFGRIRGNIAIFMIGDRDAGGEGNCPPEAVESAIRFFTRNREKLCILMTHQCADGSLATGEGVFARTAEIRTAITAGKIRIDLWFSGHTSHNASGGLANPAVVSEVQDAQGIWHANVGMHLNRYEESGDAYSITFGVLDITPDVVTGTTTVLFRRFHYQADDYIPAKSFSLTFPRLIRRQEHWDYDGSVQFDSAVDYLRGPQLISAELERDPADPSNALQTTYALILKLANTLGIDMDADVGTGLLFKIPGAGVDPSGNGGAIVARRRQATDGSYLAQLELFSALVDGTLTRGLTIRNDGLRLGPNEEAYISWGIGSPEGSKTAPRGSFYLRLDGTGGSTVFYVKKTPTGNTGWGSVTVS